MMSLLDGLKINKAIDAILDSENPKDPLFIAAHSKIKHIGRPAIPKLIDALLDSPGNKTIENLLVRLLDTKSLNDFVDALTESDRQLVTSIANILATNDTYDPNSLLKHLDDPEIPKKLLLQILTVKKSKLNVRKLTSLLDTHDKNKRNLAFHLLQAVATPEVIPFMLKYVDDADVSVRIQTIKILSQFKNESVRSTLLRALSDSNKLVRLNALDGIYQQNLEISAAHICPLLRDSDMKVQAKAIETLVKIQDPNTVGYLIEVLNDESEYVRRAAVEVLNEVADPRAIKNLLGAMRDSDWWVRVRAADALGSIGGPRVVEAVISLLSDKDEFLRRTAIEILNSVKDERAYFYLVQALDDDDWWVRERAIDALTAMGDKRVVPEFFKAIDKYSESAHILVKSIISIAGQESIPKLMEKANQATGDVRKEMLIAISEFAKTEKIDQNTSLEDISTKVMNRSGATQQMDSSGSNSLTMQNTALNSSKPEDTSAGILDLSEKDETAAVAHILDATKINTGYIIANRYKVIKHIGKGAFGVVVLVEDMMVSDQIILKFLNAHMSSDENIIQRFIHELRYARKITHEKIIRIYDFITFGNTYAISMEYFESHSLAFEMKTNKNPSLKRTIHTFKQICTGVGFAHKQDVVHRDLKPANILVNDNDEVKIVDFGLAAAASSADSRITKTGILVGTPTYMAPEQVRARTIDRRTDIYSLGILLYEIFVGRSPYKGEDHLATLFQHVEGKAVPASKANPKISDELSDIIMKTMSLNPDDRYQTAEDLSDALDDLIVDETD